MSIPSVGVIGGHLARLAQGGDTVTWEHLLPMADMARTDPGGLMDAFVSMPEQDQFHLLEVLRTGSGGPFSDLLLRVLARHCTALPEGTVREYLLDDAQRAASRTGERVEEQRKALAAEVEALTQRQAAGFDIAVVVAGLEQRRVELQQAESEDSGRFSEMHVIETEIHRLETNRRNLDGYDRDARETHRAALAQEEAALESEKRDLERRIADAIGSRDAARRSTISKQEKLESVQEEARGAAAELAQTESSLAAAQRQLDETRSRAVELNSQRQAVYESEQSIRNQVLQTIDEIRQTESVLGVCSDLAKSTAREILSTREAVESLSGLLSEFNAKLTPSNADPERKDFEA